MSAPQVGNFAWRCFGTKGPAKDIPLETGHHHQLLVTHGIAGSRLAEAVRAIGHGLERAGALLGNCPPALEARAPRIGRALFREREATRKGEEVAKVQLD